MFVKYKDAYGNEIKILDEFGKEVTREFEIQNNTLYRYVLDARRKPMIYKRKKVTTTIPDIEAVVEFENGGTGYLLVGKNKLGEYKKIIVRHISIATSARIYTLFTKLNFDIDMSTRKDLVAYMREVINEKSKNVKCLKLSELENRGIETYQLTSIQKRY